jgi:hypothetical protein
VLTDVFPLYGLVLRAPPLDLRLLGAGLSAFLAP